MGNEDLNICDHPAFLDMPEGVQKDVLTLLQNQILKDFFSKQAAAAEKHALYLYSMHNTRAGDQQYLIAKFWNELHSM